MIATVLISLSNRRHDRSQTWQSQRAKAAPKPRAIPDAGTVGDWLWGQGERGVEGLGQVNQKPIPGVLEAEGE